MAHITHQQQLLARNQVLKMDYKLMQKYPVVGMFVMPAKIVTNAQPQKDKMQASEQDLESMALSQWHGVYFVKQGLY